MNSKDLATLFQTYVKDYKVGTDDTVYKYVGAPKKDGNGVEAELVSRHHAVHGLPAVPARRRRRTAWLWVGAREHA